jgi:aminoglycoside phosphotransferase (APT) family kinase protein
MTLRSDDHAGERVAVWIEQNLGGRITAMERQPRWRDAWFVTLAQPEQILQLYVRGMRTKPAMVFSLDYEFRILRILEDYGLPVPHVYGLVPEPQAIVMAKSPGRHDLSTAANDAERIAVMDHYIELLARIHAIDPAVFEAAGMRRPEGPQALALNLLERFVVNYRGEKRRPEPFIEFMIGWIRRNVPQQRRRVTFVCADAAQFLFENGRVSALLDFEIAYLGDPIQDLAALQLRDTSEPLGDIGRALRRYRDITGTEIDAEAFDFHTIQWSMNTPLSLAGLVAQVLPTGDLSQYMEWHIHLGRMPLELIARHSGIALPALPQPIADPVRFGNLAEGLVGAIQALPAMDGFAAYQRDSAAQLAIYLRQIGEFGPGLERADIADVETLLQASFDNWQSADTALEAFVQQAGASDDARLIPLFYRRLQRQQFLHAPVLSRPDVANQLKTCAELIGG